MIGATSDVSRFPKSLKVLRRMPEQHGLAKALFSAKRSLLEAMARGPRRSGEPRRRFAYIVEHPFRVVKNRFTPPRGSQPQIGREFRFAV